MSKVEIDCCVTNLSINYNNDCESVTVKNGDISYINFFEKFMLKNVPCVIKDVTSPWQCARNWIENNTINFDYFIQTYGDLEAPVADCDSITFNAHCKMDMNVAKYMHYLKNDRKEKLLYLKDWHLRRLRPDDSFYEVPLFFSSDWLNEFATDNKTDDFMFVYIGPQNSWTPLHVDVYNSYSWSVNIVGRKKWILFPPGEEEKLKDSLGNLPLMFSTEKYSNVKYLEIIQERGDALFVPSGWHHQVVNLSDTISINHNWVNACNIEAMWLAMQKCMETVENEIIDLKDNPEFNSQCQLILKALFGMDFSNFIDFLSHIGKKRVRQLQGKEKKELRNYEFGNNHIIFDLKVLYKIMNLINTHPLFSCTYLSPDTQNNFIDIKNSILDVITL